MGVIGAVGPQGCRSGAGRQRFTLRENNNMLYFGPGLITMPGVRSSQVAKPRVCQAEAATPGDKSQEQCETGAGEGWTGHTEGHGRHPPRGPKGQRAIRPQGPAPLSSLESGACPPAPLSTPGSSTGCDSSSQTQIHQLPVSDSPRKSCCLPSNIGGAGLHFLTTPSLARRAWKSDR